MSNLIISGVLVLIAFLFFRFGPKLHPYVKYGGYPLVGLAVIITVLSCLISVPAGHAYAPTLFGKVQDYTYPEGLHFVNPLLDFTVWDLRQKTHKENAGIPAEDKLITSMDVSVQYRTIGSMVPDILRNTGTTEALIEVHMIPKLRSILREQGKGVKESQDFFKESIQKRLQDSLQVGLADYLAPKGIAVEAVLIRDIVLPAVIRDSIVKTKEREQAGLMQQAELERFATEQEQKVRTAQAEFDAAKLDAQKIKELADAEAYKINKINTTLAQSPNYIKLVTAERWNGALPVYAGGDSIPMIDLRGSATSR